jgi:exonuclease III
MKILSWNVAGLRPLPAKIPKEATQTHHAAFQQFIPQYDIVAIQECKLSSDDNITSELHVEGYNLAILRLIVLK